MKVWVKKKRVIKKLSLKSLSQTYMKWTVVNKYRTDGNWLWQHISSWESVKMPLIEIKDLYLPFKMSWFTYILACIDKSVLFSQHIELCHCGLRRDIALISLGNNKKKPAVVTYWKLPWKRNEICFAYMFILSLFSLRETCVIFWTRIMFGFSWV